VNLRRTMQMTLTMKELRGFSVERLVVLFEDSVQFDRYSVIARVGRSWPGAVLREKGPQALSVIAQHLENTQPQDKGRDILCSAWGLLLYWLQRGHSLREGPETNNDLGGWIAWARANATT
jgi:hypothetical protein